MGRQKILSGRIYDYSRGNDFTIDGISKGVIGMYFYLKKSQRCYTTDKRVEEV